MEYPWRSRPPNGNPCPVCSYSHFPFCPPPNPQFSRPPAPAPDQFFHNHLPPPPPPPPYDPFVDHRGVPALNPYPSTAPAPGPAQIPPHPWNANPNFSMNYYANLDPGLGYDNNCQIGAKRMRFDNDSDSYMGLLSEDDRRLKLIRDHGAVSHGLGWKHEGGYMVANPNFQPSNFSDKKGYVGDHFQGVEGDYRRENNSDVKQNYAETRFLYQHIDNKKNVGSRVPEADGYNNFKRPRGDHEILAYDDAIHQNQRINLITNNREFNNQFSQAHATEQHRVDPNSAYYNRSNQSENVRPPLPTSPPPPLPVEPLRHGFQEPVVSSSASGPGSLFPIAVDFASSFRSSNTMVSQAMTSASSHYSNEVNPNSSGYYPEEIQVAKVATSRSFNRESDNFSPRTHLLDKPTIIDASHILKHPHRANRPDHLVIILRGLPGSGKSYLAKILRDLEVENGGSAPRIHSMDEYFITEVEKVEESEGLRSSGTVRGKKPVMKKVMEYCYEPEMEEAYRSSMLKAFKKTLDEGAFPFVIVDDRNLWVADFAQFWATAKRSGYEVYLLEATYKDPAGCAARNVHGFTQNDIHKMANQWEEAPPLYMKLDIKSLLHGDALEENGIEEVDMDTEDGNYGDDPSGSEDTNIQKTPRPSEDPSIDKKNGDGTEEHPVEMVKELGKSKWSNDFHDDDVHKTEVISGNSSALSSLNKSYSKKGKSVRWGDQVGRVGFSIGAGNVYLVIGPGSGYNSKSNPLPEEEKLVQRYTGESRKRSNFQEQLRAEREALRAVFDQRKTRIGVLDADQ